VEPFIYFKKRFCARFIQNRKTGDKRDVCNVQKKGEETGSNTQEI
jgi:hypothetical protein